MVQYPHAGAMKDGSSTHFQKLEYGYIYSTYQGLGR